MYSGWNVFDIRNENLWYFILKENEMNIKFFFCVEKGYNVDVLKLNLLSLLCCIIYEFFL